MKFNSTNVKTAFAVFFFALPNYGVCQTGAQGIPELYQASSEMNRWYHHMADLVLVIGAISGLLGGLRVYANWQSGKHHIDSQVMGWFFSCLFLSLLGTALKALFGVH